jgi:hypothetical protein
MDDASDLPQSNVTHAGITGKVPKIRVRGSRGKRKAVKLSPDKRHHAKQLAKQGLISGRAAASHGLQGKK